MTTESGETESFAKASGSSGGYATSYRPLDEDMAAFHVEESGSLKTSRKFSRREKLYTAGMFALTTLFLYADQNLMAPNLTAIAEDFGFSDDERDTKLGGQVAAGFFLLGAPVSLLVGWLTDRVERRALFVAVIFLGEVPCLLTYWVQHYWQLFTLRTLTGIAIGGAFPLTFSIMGDIFSTDERAVVSSLLSASMGLGTILGQALAGAVGPTYGWRLPFVLTAAPALVLALVLLGTTREPVRAGAEAALKARIEDEGLQYTHRISWAKVAASFRIRTNVLLYSQGVVGCIPWGMINTYLNDFMSQDKSLTVEEATTALVLFGVGAALGNLAGGVLGQHLYSRYSPGAVPVLCSSTTLLGTLPLLWLLNADYDHGLSAQVAAAAGLAGFVACFTGSNVRAMLLNVNTPETRGTVFAIFNLMDDLGRGLGPAGVAALISATGSRIIAFNISTGGWALCAMVLFMLTFTYKADETRMQQILAAAAIELPSTDPTPTEFTTI